MRESECVRACVRACERIESGGSWRSERGLKVGHPVGIITATLQHHHVR